MTTTANVTRFVHSWSERSFRRRGSGARSASYPTLISMGHIIGLAGRIALDAQGNLHTDMNRNTAVYQLTNRLGNGRTVPVSAAEIVPTVSAWLAELGAASPLVEELARAVRACDWPTAHALGDYLSVEVAVAE